jgi:MFS family permease
LTQRNARFSLAWINRDGKILITSSGIRAFAQGAAAVILAVYLDKLGFSLLQIGAFLSVGVAGSAVLTFVVSLISERVGRRRLMVSFALLMGLAGIGLAFTSNFIGLVVIAFFGSVGAGPMSPAGPLEQASMTDTAMERRRTDVFAVYRIAGLAGGTIGALAVGLPPVLQSWFSLSELDSLRAIYIIFSFVLFVSAFLYLFLSDKVEVVRTGKLWSNPLKLPSRRLIFTLTGLFTLDSFAGALFMQSLAAYWFYTRFGLSLPDLALVFSLSNILAAASLWLAAKMGNWIGLINTMVFTHIPSSLFLIGAVFSPTAALAIVFWQLRAFFSMMDVPTRDSYTMSVVQPQERVAMAGIHTVGRSAAGTVAPLLATAVWQAFSATVPILGCAVLKIVYDATLYGMFRKVKPPQELEKGR